MRSMQAIGWISSWMNSFEANRSLPAQRRLRPLFFEELFEEVHVGLRFPRNVALFSVLQWLTTRGSATAFCPPYGRVK
jgi:hypothetical protein